MRISRNWATTHFTFWSLVVGLRNVLVPLGESLSFQICYERVRRLKVCWKSNLLQSWTHLVLIKWNVVSSGYAILLRVCSAPLPSCFTPFYTWENQPRAQKGVVQSHPPRYCHTGAGDQDPHPRMARLTEGQSGSEHTSRPFDSRKFNC